MPPDDQQHYPLYLSNGSGCLRVPATMTRADYKLLRQQIENSLFVIEATAVIDDSPPLPSLKEFLQRNPAVPEPAE